MRKLTGVEKAGTSVHQKVLTINKTPRSPVGRRTPRSWGFLGAVTLDRRKLDSAAGTATLIARTTCSTGQVIAVKWSLTKPTANPAREMEATNMRIVQATDLDRQSVKTGTPTKMTAHSNESTYIRYSPSMWTYWRRKCVHPATLAPAVDCFFCEVGVDNLRRAGPSKARGQPPPRSLEFQFARVIKGAAGNACHGALRLPFASHKSLRKIGPLSAARSSDR